MGGMQVLEWAARHTERVLLRRADRHRGVAFLAEHRLPRGRPAGRDGRSRLVQRRATMRAARCRATASPSRAWPRTSPTCPRRRCSASSAAACRIALAKYVLVQRRLPGRKLSAPPGLDVRRPLRRQQLSLHHARHGLLRSRRRARRRAGQRLPRHQDALLRRVVHQRLALSDAREPRDRARAERGGGQRLASSRSRATRATTPSCSRSRSCSPPSAASSTRPRAKRGLKACRPACRLMLAPNAPGARTASTTC